MAAIPLIAGACAPGCAGIVVAVGMPMALPAAAVTVGVAAVAFARHRSKLRNTEEEFEDCTSEPEVERVKVNSRLLFLAKN